jgi:cytochrome P450
LIDMGRAIVVGAGPDGATQALRRERSFPNPDIRVSIVAVTVTDVDDPYADFDAMSQFVGTVAGDVRDPYPDLARRRRETPVEIRQQVLYEGIAREAVYVYRYDDVAAVMRDAETFSSGVLRELMGVVMGPDVLVGLDAPEHRRHRSLVTPAFRAKALERWEASLVREVIDELVDRFAGRGHAELVRELTFRFPVQVIAAILGVPRQDHPRFHRWAMAIINVAADPVAGLEASESLRQYLSTIVADRRRNPGDDVISDLVTAELDGERLTDDEIYSFLRLLLPGGAETTYRATGNCLFALLTHTDALEAVQADRALLPQAVEEGIRWETPLLISQRVATVDTEIAGVPVPAGMPVVPHIGSANHDEAHWDDPESFRLARPPQPALMFGAGPHMCLGMHLARMEVRVAIDHLLDRLPNLRLDPDADDVHIHGDSFRSPTQLPVLFG